MHDAIEIDDRGRPAAVICTEPFVNTVKAIASIRGLPNYRFAVIKHPIGSLTEEELRQRAKEALPQVRRILEGP